MRYYSTTAVAKMLGVHYYTLFSAINSGKLKPPAKDSGNAYVWVEDDIERARKLFAARDVWLGKQKKRQLQSA